MILNFSFLPFRTASIFGFTLKLFVRVLRKKQKNYNFQLKKLFMELKNKKIDIILPNYNSSKYIEQTIKSVVNQSYKF